MKTLEKLDFIENEVNNLAKRYKEDRNRHKRNALALKVLSVLLAAIITVLLGLQVDSVIAVVLKNIALALGAVITVVNAFEAFFDPHTLWVKETTVFVRLKDLQRDIAFYRKGRDETEVEEKQVERFKNRLHDILQDSLQDWLKIRGENTAQAAEKDGS